MATQFSIKQITLTQVTNVGQNINVLATINPNPKYNNVETYNFTLFRGQYNQQVQGQLDTLSVGDIIDMDFNVKCKEYNGKYYTNLVPVKATIVVKNPNAPAKATPKPVQQVTPEEVEDQIPF